MEDFKIQIIETLIIFSLYIVLYFVFKTIINNFLKKTRLERGRRKMAIRAVQLFNTITRNNTLLTGVWGLNKMKLHYLQVQSLTLWNCPFAQWSCFPNITSSILIFFNHPVRLGDSIKVLHKDYNYEGEVVELNYFFVHLKTSENQIITIPNSHFFDKSFSVLEHKENHNQIAK
ncbi:MAG: mechanosensitive ion channel [Bacteroidetes bacterium]|nr:mechanosensitive ion channel [Bacteroidota bacterium]